MTDEIKDEIENEEDYDLEVGRELSDAEIIAALPEEVSFYIKNLGKIFAITRGDYKQFFGILLGVRFTPTEFIFLITDEDINYSKKIKIVDERIMRIPPSRLIDLQLVTHREIEPYE